MDNNLLALAEALKAETERPENETILIYGDSSTGKTRMMASLAKIPWVEHVYWFDLENGSSALLTLVRSGYLTPEEAAKIILFKIPDTPDMPSAFETMLKILAVPSSKHKICKVHGRSACPDCAKNKEAVYQGEFSLMQTTPRDWVVTDTISQLGDSIMNYLCRGKPQGFKPGWDEYGPQGRELNVALTTMQAARYCNFAASAQALPVEYEELGVKKDRIYPLCGTKPFSVKVGKYFAHKIYLSLENKQHKAGSSTKYKMGVMTGSRSDWRIEDLTVDQRLDTLYEMITKGDSGQKLVQKK